MLDDADRRPVETHRRFPRRVEIEQVVVRQFFARQNFAAHRAAASAARRMAIRPPLPAGKRTRTYTPEASGRLRGVSRTVGRGIQHPHHTRQQTRSSRNSPAGGEGNGTHLTETKAQCAASRRYTKLSLKIRPRSVRRRGLMNAGRKIRAEIG